jgi:AraC-like DNA-binding protein
MYSEARTPRTKVLLECGSRIVKETYYDSSSGSETAIPECVGSGTCRSMMIGEDILIIMPKADSITNRDGVVTETSHEEPRIGFCLTREVGEGAQCWLGGSREREAMRSRWSYINSAHATILSYYPPLSRVELFAMFVGVERLVGIVDGAGRPSSRLMRLFGEPGNEPLMLSAPSDTMSGRIVSQIENNPFVGGLGKLYLEAKALELCALQIAPYSLGEEKARIVSKNARKIDEVRDFIDGRLGNPPTLQEISKTFGISLSKLKRDFKSVNGLGVHEYTISRRLEMAREMILTGSVSIKQASYVAGYRSSSQFSQAYKRRYGRPPNSERV